MTHRLDQGQMQLYANLLLDAIGGPYARRIRTEVGDGSTPLYEALLDRVEKRLGPNENEWELDAIDWAALRSLVPVTLRMHHPTDFHSATGFQVADLEALGEMAIDTIREFRTPPDGISYQIARCLVTLPVEYIAQGVRLVAVPDEASWDLVISDCAQGRREEFLEPMRRHFGAGRPGLIWEERSARSVDELRAYLRERSQNYRRERGAPKRRKGEA